MLWLILPLFLLLSRLIIIPRPLSLMCLKPRRIGEILCLGSIDSSIQFGIHRIHCGLLNLVVHSISVLVGLEENDVPMSLMRLAFTADSVAATA
ncbi:hypothetical protein F4859DRAFT_489731 [Xylaria cf. heliscus]|nr:hypothetical protein F4859DRAFT_489731 [Xylaria cf. heliscus]